MWEVNSAKLPQEEQEEERRLGAASAREDQYRLAGTSQAANSGTTQRNSRWRHDDIPKEKIISIFNSEMAKLREQESNLERAIASRSFGTGHIRRVSQVFWTLNVKRTQSFLILSTLTVPISVSVTITIIHMLCHNSKDIV